MTERPTGTVTFLFTDLESSTRLWQDEPGAMRTALARHDEILRSAIGAAAGHIVKHTGDGVVAVFSRAGDALAAALAAQRRLGETGESDGPHLRVRMAVHTGEAQERDGDYFGTALNQTARLLEVGYGDQVLVSAASVAVAGVIPAGCTLLDLGRHRLRDFPDPMQIYQLAHRDLRSEFPPPAGVGANPNNLPLQQTAFVGRSRELAEIRSLLDSSRLLSLTGVGGSGKTRLALQAAADLLDRYPDGVWVAELASVTDEALVASEVAALFGVYDIETGTDRSVAAVLAEHLRTKSLLLVIDNCEHMLEPCGSLIGTLQRACPDVQIMATSRETLGVPGEVVYRVPPLDTSGGLDGVDADTEAVELFADRAGHVRPGFTLTADNRMLVGEITERLEGLPLAIELAASRISHLSPQQILDRLGNLLDLLAGKHPAPTHHETLRAAMDWSFDLLDRAEQELLCSLAVFSRGWTLEAAEAVCLGSGPGSLLVLDLLGGLVDKSLVEVSQEDEAYRYRLLEPVRQYALSQFGDPEDEEGARRRHADHYLALARSGDVGLRGPEQAGWIETIATEHANIRRALRWAIDAGDAERALKLVAAMGWFWWMRGHWKEGMRWFRRGYGLDPKADRALRGRAVYKAASIETMRARPADVSPLLEEALADFRALEDRAGIAWTTFYLAHYLLDPAREAGLLAEATAMFAESGDAWGHAYAVATAIDTTLVEADDPEEGLRRARVGIDRFVELGDRWMASWMAFLLGQQLGNEGRLDDARGILAESMELASGTGDRWAIPHARCRLGIVETMAGELDEAMELLGEALPVLRRIGDENCTSMSLAFLGEAHTLRGDYESAREYLREALEGYVGLANPFGVGNCLRRFAWLVEAEGEHERAATLLGCAEEACRELQLSVHDRARFDRSVESVRAELGEQRWEEARAAGAALDRDEGIRLALG